MEMKSNNATNQQIPTEYNGQATPQITMDDNVAYDQVTPQITTEDNIAYSQREHESDYNLLSDQCEYDYIQFRHEVNYTGIACMCTIDIDLC